MIKYSHQHALSCSHSLTFINCMLSGCSVVKHQECRQFTPHDSETPQTKNTNVYYHCKPEFDWLRNPYCHPEELQIEDVLNTKLYWQHLELIQIENTVKQIKPERKHLTLFEISFFNFFSRAQPILSRKK